tara:strand:+ start:1299 stop:1667 length:369 start_codon:yes stop_codon:yes gene_type:complete
MGKRKQQVYKMTAKKTGVYFIDRKRYELEKATIISEEWGGGYVGSGQWWKEYLFVTDKGSWILHGNGERETKYATRLPNGNWIEGTSIKIFTRIEAYHYLEDNKKMDDVLVERYFFDIIEEG